MPIIKVLAFWIAYILTRPLGGYLSQPSDRGGLGVGTAATTALFLLTILILVSYLTVSRKDQAVARAVDT